MFYGIFKEKKGSLVKMTWLKSLKDLTSPKIELEGVISFYHFLHRKDAGKYTIYLNCSTISKLHQYQQVKKAFENELGIKIGNVTKTDYLAYLKPLVLV